jgi:hypothetical protein
LTGFGLVMGNDLPDDDLEKPSGRGASAYRVLGTVVGGLKVVGLVGFGGNGPFEVLGLGCVLGEDADALVKLVLGALPNEDLVSIEGLRRPVGLAATTGLEGPKDRDGVLVGDVDGDMFSNFVTKSLMEPFRV